LRSDTALPACTKACPSVENSAYRARAEAALPPPLLTSPLGSFARRTIAVRQPQIIERLVRENGYPDEVVKELWRLRDEILQRTVQPLREVAPDTASWNDLIASHSSPLWLDAGWYFAEAFFYRRLLEAVRYFQAGPWRGVDPFASQKQVQQAKAVDEFEALPGELADENAARAFEALLHSSLWGNRADLSNLSLRATPRSGLAARLERDNIISDESDRALGVLSRGVARVDFVADNVGMDALADLALADFLLRSGWAEAVVVHLKDRPFFVSDAMVADIAALVSLLARSPRKGARVLAEHLTTDLADGRIRLTDDPFWASGLMFRDLPIHISRELAQSDLVILKGDVNYRRLLDDRQWPFTTPIAVCSGFFPAQFLVLRTLKGEILAGLAPGEAEAYASEDPAWLTNGKRGVVQMGGPAGLSAGA